MTDAASVTITSHLMPVGKGGTPNDIAGRPRGLISGQSKRSGARALAVEERDRQAVEFLVGRLRDDLVLDLDLRVLLYPAGDVVAHLLAVGGERGGKNLHAGDLHDAHERTSRTICATSDSVRVRLLALARARTAFASGSSAGISWRASQCLTFESPLIGPISICCSLPNSPAGTPLYTRSASQRSPLRCALMIAAACTPVAVRNASAPASGELTGSWGPVTCAARCTKRASFDMSRGP